MKNIESLMLVLFFLSTQSFADTGRPVIEEKDLKEVYKCDLLTKQGEVSKTTLKIDLKEKKIVSANDEEENLPTSIISVRVPNYCTDCRLIDGYQKVTFFGSTYEETSNYVLRPIPTDVLRDSEKEGYALKNYTHIVEVVSLGLKDPDMEETDVWGTFACTKK